MRQRSRRRFSWLQVFLLCTAFAAADATGPGYDPLAVDVRFRPEILDLAVSNGSRQREIPILVYLPAQKTPAPVVLFSHGLGGSRHGSAFLGRHWSGRGYVVVYVQHPGSDAAVWQDKPAGQRFGAMRRAAGVQNFLLRAQDVSTVLDRLAAWNGEAGHALRGRLDMGRVGMSGHSFGAVTTQAVSGQSFPGIGRSFTDPRIRAALAMSPSCPRRGGAAEAFGAVAIPWLLMTGTKDVAIIGTADAESRLAVFPALPPGGKYELVLSGAEHSAFTDRSLPGDREPRNPNHHRAILAIGTAFWDAWLRGDTAARAWLNGDGPRSVLEEEDRWQKK